MITKLVFDFDGVLNNESEAIINAFDKIAKESKKSNGRELFVILTHMDEQYGYFPFDEITKKTLKYVGIKEEYVQTFKEEFKAELKPNYEIINWIKTSDKYEKYILSSEKRENIEEFLKRYKIENLFKDIFAPIRKWHFAEMRETIERISKNPKEILVIGDKAIDLLIPKYLGCNVILYNKELGSGIKEIIGKIEKQ